MLKRPIEASPKRNESQGLSDISRMERALFEQAGHPPNLMAYAETRYRGHPPISRRQKSYSWLCSIQETLH